MTTTPADLEAHLSAAPPAATLLLTGDFGQVTVKDRTFDPPIYIDASGATFEWVLLQNVTGVVWSGGEYYNPIPGDWHGAFYVGTGSRGIHASGLIVEGNDGAAIVVRDSFDCHLAHSEIAMSRTGIQFINVDGFSIDSCMVSNPSSDGIDVYSCWHGSVTFCAVVGGRDMGDGAHSDGIQIANTVEGVPPMSDVEVAHCMIYGSMQGICGFNNPDAPTGVGYDRISFHDNSVMVDFANGVALTDARDSQVKNNRVWSLPGSAYYAQLSADDSIEHCGNVVYPAPDVNKPGYVEDPCPPPEVI
jgi:hypothetical protein